MSTNDDANTTAATSYAAHLRNVSAMLDWLGCELEAHAEKQKADARNWGFVGDLVELERLVKRALGHVSGMSDARIDQALAVMPNLTSILNEQIRRLARREITAQTKTTKRLTAQYRRDIAALKRQVAALQKTVAFLQAQEKRRVAQQPSPAKPAEGVRFRADGIKSHRARLGLSAADYGRLVGASGLSVYYWVSGKARPRTGQLTKLVAVRGIGKREALKRLELIGDHGARRWRR
jgi:DNA-binding transcriptional regulator YiaG